MSLSQEFLPQDWPNATLLGRIWHPQSAINKVAGPSPVLISDKGVLDLSGVRATISELIADGALKLIAEAGDLPNLGSVEDILENTLSKSRDQTKPYFLAPVDIQPIKACGVTFACSMIERVIEENAAGDPAKASDMRGKVMGAIGGDLSKINPGSSEALKLKDYLIGEGMWSQYLEVGIGPYAEVFSKSQILSAVGLGDEVGLNPISTWNNPEPEVVLVVTPLGKIVGATLGNDVNLRDVEGRSALLLGKAKDNNASCSIGPFIRLLDNTFTIDDIRSATVALTIDGQDGYKLSDESRMSEISRDISDLVAQTINSSHQYPDGFVLFTGTLFAPTQDRDEVGQGFTHKLGDVVSISSPKLGTLRNRVTTSDKAKPWTFGINAFMKNLAARGLL